MLISFKCINNTHYFLPHCDKNLFALSNNPLLVILLTLHLINTRNHTNGATKFSKTAEASVKKQKNKSKLERNVEKTWRIKNNKVNATFLMKTALRTVCCPNEVFAFLSLLAKFSYLCCVALLSIRRIQSSCKRRWNWCSHSCMCSQCVIWIVYSLTCLLVEWRADPSSLCDGEWHVSTYH